MKNGNSFKEKSATFIITKLANNIEPYSSEEFHCIFVVFLT
jgi:hypothetical protein